MLKLVHSHNNVREADGAGPHTLTGLYHPDYKTCRIQLEPKQIHVWRVPLVTNPAEMAAYLQVLEPAERQRAESFKFTRDRMDFVKSHGTLRMVLSQYLGVAAESIRYELNPYGKPLVRSEPGVAPVFFSLSHSGSTAAIAVASQTTVGIDVEAARPVDEIEGLARLYFSPGEADKLDPLSWEQREAAFFRCWTRKEAFVKATGLGLSLDLNQFEVTLLPDEAPALLRCLWDQAEAQEWSMIDIDLGGDSVAALAVRSREFEILHFEWDLVL